MDRIGFALNVADDDTYLDRAREIEALGYTAVWISGGQLRTLEPVRALIRGTRSLRVGTAINPPDVYASDEVAALYAELEATDPGRFVVGLGAPQRPRALAPLHDYLDRLDAAEPPVPAARRILAALGPRKLALARERFAGAIPLLATPEYTAWARAALGPDRTLTIYDLVAPDADVDRGRDLARGTLRFLTGVGGYPAHLARLGFSAAEISGLDNRLVDAVVALGDVEAVAARVERHLAAGADHVALGVLGADRTGDAVALARELAGRFAAA